MSPLHQIFPEDINTEVRARERKKLLLYKIKTGLLGLIALLLLLIFLHSHGWAQQHDYPKWLRKQLFQTGLNVGGLGGNSSTPLFVSCVSGCSSTAGPSFGSTFPLTGIAVGVKNSGNFVNLNADGSGNLDVNCLVGCSASAGFLDNAAFTAGTTPISLTGGWYSTSPTNCTSGSGCAPQLTLDRKLYVQDFQGTSPWVVSNGGTFAVQAAQSGTWNVANTGTFAVQATDTQGNAGSNAQAWWIEIGDTSHGPVAVKAASTQAAAADPSLVVQINPNQPALTTPLNVSATDNVTQFGGTNLSTGTGASGAGIPRVTISNDSSLAANQSVNVNQLAGSNLYADPCLVNAPSVYVVNFLTNTTTTMIAGVSAKQTYLCGVFLIAGAADNLNIVEGTGSNCSSISAGLIGGTTAATGAQLAANSGFVVFGGGYWVAKTATAADNVCFMSASVIQVSGVIKYVQQ